MTNTATYYHRFSKLNAFAGITYLLDNAGSGTLLTNQLTFNYSQDLIIKNLLLKVGAAGTYQQKTIDYSKLTFGDQIDQTLGFIQTSEDVAFLKTESDLFFNFGASAFWKGFSFGGSVYNLGSQSLPATNPLKFGFQLAKSFSLNIRKHEYTLSPFIINENQQNFHRTEFGIINQLDWIVLGFSYRSQDAINSMIGIQTKYIGVMYSYDATVSKLAGNTGGSHEVSLQFYPFKGWTKKVNVNKRIKSVFML